jgi:protein-disulfide isomerase
MNATVWSAQLAVPVLPNRDQIRGPAFARVSLLEYGDDECPYTSVAHAIINRIQTQLQSQMRFVFRHFLITTAHPHAQMAAEAAEAAGSQGKFWQMHSALFVTESPLTNSALADSAAAIGLNMASVPGRDQTAAHDCSTSRGSSTCPASSCNVVKDR